MLLAIGKAGFRARVLALVLASTSALTGCAGQSENWSPRTPVDEESQSESAASLEANPPARPGDDVAIGVDSAQYEDTDPSAITDFKPVLEPYGSWEEDAKYGTVWYPSTTVVGADFVPYSTAGHWTYDGSYVWVSDYSWGWVPFHYGRWVLVAGRGWAWIPGRTYSGAWVTWAVGPSYVGWAPMAPTFYWYRGYAVGLGFYPSPYYVYCPHSHLFHHHVHSHVVHGPAAAPIAASTPPYVAANPSVNPAPAPGPGRVAATPSVNPGRVTAAPTVGPAPSLLGHNEAAIVRPPRDGNVGKARAFSTPAEAKLVGGRAPSASAAQARGDFVDRNGAAALAGSSAVDRGERPEVARVRPGSAASQSAGVDPWRLDPPTPVRRAPTSQSFSGRSDPLPPIRGFETRTLGAQSDPNLVLPSSPYRGAAPPTRAPAAAPIFRSPSTTHSPSFSPSPAPQAAPFRSPSTSPGPQPMYRAPSPSPAAPVYRAPTPMPSPAPAAPVYRPSPAPVYRAPAPMPAAPAYRPPTPAPAFRPAPAAPVSRPAPAPARPSFSPIRR